MTRHVVDNWLPDCLPGKTAGLYLESKKTPAGGGGSGKRFWLLCDRFAEGLQFRNWEEDAPEPQT